MPAANTAWPGATLFDGLPHASARALLAWACTVPEGPIPDGLVEAALAEPSAGEWLVGAAKGNRLVGLLWGRLTPQQRDMLPSPMRQEFADAHLVCALRGAAQRRFLERCVTKLAAAGIPVIVLKGAALMGTVYSDPAERVMHDLDLLVPDEQLERARAELSQDVPSMRPDRPDFRHLGALLLPGEYTSVELHGTEQHLSWWPQLRPGDPFARAESLPVGATTAYGLGPADNVLHLACHGVRHSFSYWPTMAADLSRLLGPAGWEPGRWGEVCEAAARKGRQRSLVIAAAFACAGRSPPGPREALAEPVIEDAERRARLAWRAAFDDAEPTVNCWHRAWVRDSGPFRRGEILQFVFPSLRWVARRFGVSLGVAALVYPWYAAARAAKTAIRGVRWALLLRRYR